MLEAYLEIWEEGYFEVKEAFKGLTDENVWKRPAEGLLSVGELAAHVAYWEAVRFAGESGGETPPLAPDGTPPDLLKCLVQSPLIDHRFRYHPTTLEQLPTEAHIAMSAVEVCAELVRVHSEAVAHFKALNPNLDSCPPGLTHTWRACVTYAAFHVAYHTGQIYSARHLLGEVTPDN